MVLCFSTWDCNNSQHLKSLSVVYTVNHLSSMQWLWTKKSFFPLVCMKGMLLSCLYLLDLPQVMEIQVKSSLFVLPCYYTNHLQVLLYAASHFFVVVQFIWQTQLLLVHI